MKKIIEVPNIKFNQKYEIEDDGTIWSPYRGPKKLNPSPTKKGYYRIVLQTSEGRKTFQVHRLVMMTFKPVENMEMLEVNHIDGDKSNNNLTNLEWCSSQENTKHAVETGLRKSLKGTQVANSVLTEKEVLEICEKLQSGTDSLTKIGEEYGVSKYCIFDIKHKKSWAWLTKDYNFN